MRSHKARKHVTTQARKHAKHASTQTGDLADSKKQFLCRTKEMEQLLPSLNN